MVSQFTVWLALSILAAGSSWFVLPLAWSRALLWSARRLAGFRSHTIEVNGRTWHYLSAGEGPVILALHGFGADADHWLRVGAVLRRQFRIVAPDLPGFGSSDAGDDLPFDIPSQAGRVEDFMLALEINECILAGSSMGGWIASTVAASSKSHIRALWLLAPLGVARCKPGELLLNIEKDCDSPLQIRTPGDFQSRVFRPMFAHPPWLPYPLRALYGRRAVARSDSARRMFGQVIRSPQPLETIASRVVCPTLVVWGERDRAVDVSGLDCLAAAFPDVETRILSDTGHLPMLEAARESLTGFLEFCQRQHLIPTPRS